MPPKAKASLPPPPPDNPGDASASYSEPIRASATVTAHAAANARARQKRSLKAAQENRVKRRWTNRKPKPPPPPKTKNQFRARHEQDQATISDLRQQLEAAQAKIAQLTADQELTRAAYDAEWSEVCEDLRLSPFDVEPARKRAREGCRQWWEEEEERQEQLRAKRCAGEPERQKRDRKWKAQEAELEESKGREYERSRLLFGAGIKSREDLDQFLERHTMARADEERCDLISHCDGAISA